MDRWDMLLLAGSAYVAVISLVRLMARRRNQLIRQVQREIEEQTGAAPAAADESGTSGPGAGNAEREVA